MLMNKIFKKIKSNNYYIVLITSVIIIILTLLLRSLYLDIRNKQISESIFSNKNINQINDYDLNFALDELNEAILYVSYTNSKEIYKMEKKLYKEIKKNNLTDKIVYMDVTNFKDSYIDLLKNKFPNVSYEIVNAPILIYIKNGQAVEAVSSELKLINYKVLNDMISKYEIE